MVIKVSPLVHIEVVVPDAEKAYQFLNKSFGAEKVEVEFAEILSKTNVVKALHVKLGNTIIQFIEPKVSGTSWAEQLEKKGPSVHNLTFLVEDIREAKKAFRQEGAKVLFQFRVDWDELFDSEDLREKIPAVAMIDGEDIVGFKFELSEKPLKGDKVPEKYHNKINIRSTDSVD